jgi:NAD(P)-dependent dehydrogenase (short-subunit alcohol dehydrogenase family)
MKECVLITGAVKNTGFVIAETFAAKGHTVFITSRRTDEAEIQAAKISKRFNAEACGIGFDQGNLDSIIPLFNQIAEKGCICTMLILNAAAQGMNMDPLTVDGDEWAEVIKTNIIGGFLCAREAARRIKTANTKGSILFIASNTARRAIPARSAYVSSKGGIISLCKALAVDLGPYGIRVNSLVPGMIHTERWDTLDAETVQARRKRAPLRMEATFQNIADAAYFLSTPLSANTTGAELVVDGGCDAQLFNPA